MEPGQPVNCLNDAHRLAAKQHLPSQKRAIEVGERQDVGHRPLKHDDDAVAQAVLPMAATCPAFP